ncbi:MAG: DUF561 domain-containing protein [Candidatus Gastranaerophilales bacterium]|nr:DUF561 domain-containing protein [Candidatus Gastranaerophilales bacterium]
MGIEVFKKHLREKRAIILSCGSSNINTEQISRISRAAQSAKASAISIASSKEAYECVKKNSKLSVFVNSIHPFEILNAVKMGVDGVIIGNYFDVYKQGKKFDFSEIYDIVLESLSLINDYDVYKIVTIPASISFDEQCQLVNKLNMLGVDMIQTEGYKKSSVNSTLILESPELAIKSMVEINKNTSLLISSSCINSVEALKSAFDYGASAVNIETILTKLDSEVAIKTKVFEMVGSVSYRNSLNKEIVRTPRELTFGIF